MTWRVRIETYLVTEIINDMLGRWRNGLHETHQIREAITAVTRMFVTMDMVNMAVPHRSISQPLGCGSSHCEVAP